MGVGARQCGAGRDPPGEGRRAGGVGGARAPMRERGRRTGFSSPSRPRATLRTPPARPRGSPAPTPHAGDAKTGQRGRRSSGRGRERTVARARAYSRRRRASENGAFSPCGLTTRRAARASAATRCVWTTSRRPGHVPHVPLFLSPLAGPQPTRPAARRTRRPPDSSRAAGRPGPARWPRACGAGAAAAGGRPGAGSGGRMRGPPGAYEAEGREK